MGVRGMGTHARGVCVLLLLACACGTRRGTTKRQMLKRMDRSRWGEGEGRERACDCARPSSP